MKIGNNIFTLFLISVMAMSSCDTNDIAEIIEPVQPEVDEEEPEVNLTGIVMSIPTFKDDSSVQTKTSLQPSKTGMMFNWTPDDLVAVYTSSSSMASFYIKEVSQNARYAAFSGGGFNLAKGNQYYAFSPYNGDEIEKTKVRVDYNNQIQSASNSTSHLMAFDYMAAKALAVERNEAYFEFSHLGAIASFDITSSKSETFTSFSLVSDASLFTTTGTVDLTAEHPSITPLTTNKELSVALGANGWTVGAGSKMTVYIFLAPVSTEGRSISYKLSTAGGQTYTGTVTASNIEAQNYYKFNIQLQ